MQHFSRTFRIFVSSTFSDLKAERDALQEKVFPRLRQLCAERSCRFQAIDLRWGIGQEAALDQRTMEICLEEVSRCQRITPRPNFIVLLGDRYGWCPLPALIDAPDFARLLAHASAEERSLLAWGDEQPETAKGWYRLDRNVRCACADQADAGAYVLQPRTGLYTDYAMWEPVERRLHELLAREFAASPALSSRQRLNYTASATEQEFALGALAAGDPDHVFAFFRQISNVEGLAADIGRSPAANEFLDVSPDGRPDAAAARKVSDLKETISRCLGDNVRNHYTAAWTGTGITTSHLPQLCEDVYEALKAAIEKEINTIQASSPIEQEAHEHAVFGLDRARPELFVGRDEALLAIDRYIAGPRCEPLAFIGPSGIGKSTLLARVIQTQEAVRSGRVVVGRFVGATAASSDVRSLLEDVCEQIAAAYGDVHPIPKDYVALVEALPRLLANARESKPLLVVLDGLNQLSEDGNMQSLAWLPRSLPPHAKLIVSATIGRCSEHLRQLLPGEQLIGLEGLSASEGASLLDRWLAKAQRTLQPGQRKMILRGFECNGLPLFLKLAFERGRRWRSYDPVVPLAEDVDGLLRDFFQQLENPANHGPMLIRNSLGFLAAARHGLSEDEMLDLLSSDPELLAHVHSRSQKSPDVERLPVVIWSRVFFELEPYLATRASGGTITITFHSDAVRSAAAARYLSSTQDALGRHQALAANFRRQADPKGDDQWAGMLLRGFTELAFHVYQCARLADAPAPVYALALDMAFRKRQFEVTRRIEPVLECFQFAVERATTSRDPAATVLLAQAHSRFNFGLARTFFFQLAALAQSDPEFARSVAELFPDQASRLMAMLLVAWISYDQPERQPLARHIVAQLNSSNAVVDVGWVTILIWIMRDLVRAGLLEAAGLARLVPECPLRRVCGDVWAQAGGIEQQLAAAFREPQDSTVSSEAWSRAMEIGRFTAKAERQGMIHRGPSKFEEQCAARFGPNGPGTAWAWFAADRLVNSHREEARLVLNRSLYLGPGSILFQPWRTQMAMLRALMAQGEQDLAREYRDRITTSIASRAKIFRDKALLWEFALIIEDLAPWHNEEYLPNPFFQKFRIHIQKTLHAEAQPPEARIDALLHRACQFASDGKSDEAAQTLGEIIPALGDGIANNDRIAVLVAVAALSHALKSAEPPGSAAELESASIRVCVLFSPLIEGNELTEELRNVFEVILQGQAAALAAVALALRLEGMDDIFYALAGHAMRRHVSAELLDAIVAQIPLLATVDKTALRNINTALEKMDHRLGVPTGLGMYYFTEPWLCLVSVGVLFTAAGWSARDVQGMAAAVVGGAGLGALYDLWLWSQWRLWQKPERSRRFGLATGTSLGIWSTLMFLYTEPTTMQWPERMGYAFTGTLGIGIAGIVGLALGWLFFGERMRSLQTRCIIAATAVGLAGTAILFSPALLRVFGPQALAGVLLGGALFLACGLNMLVKFVPVRRFFHAAGIRLDYSEDADTFSPFRAPVAEFKETELLKTVARADRMQTCGQFAAAEAGYTAVIEHPDFRQWIAERQEMVFVQRGLARRSRGESEEAMADQRQAAALSPTIPAPWMNLALVLAQDLRRYSAGHEAFTEAIVRDPSNADAFSSRGLTSESMGDTDSARADLETALQLDPHHPDALSNLGGLLLQDGQLAAAVDVFRRSVEADPRDHLNRFNYAIALARSGAEAEAMRVLREDQRALRLWQQKRREHFAP